MTPFGAIKQAVQAAKEARPVRTCEVNLSPLGEGLPTITFREPGTADIFAATQDVMMIRKKRPDFPETLAQQVALLAISHVLPAPSEGERALDIYLDMADDKDTFMYILKRHQQEFPDVHDFSQARENAAKN